MERDDMPRRFLEFQGILVVIAILLFPIFADAQADWPTRPVIAIVPFPAGGATDNLVRAFAEKLSDALGQPFVVTNCGGAAGGIGTELAAKATPDGYTFLFGPANPLTIVPYIRKTTYKLNDFVPVARLGTYIAGMAVRNSLPVNSLQEFVTLAKSKPGQITFGSSGIGSMAHIRIEALKQAAGIDVLHVPYRGGPAEMQDLLGDRLDAMTENIIFPMAKSGKLRMLAIIGDHRLSDFPNIPTVAEAGFPELNTPGTFAIFAPRRTPATIVTRLNAEVVKIARLPEMRDQMLTIGFDMGYDTPQEIKAAVEKEAEIYQKIIRAGNIKAE
jgi:tripartite-type tricarboxylate transporter receptor subunit TctC